MGEVDIAVAAMRAHRSIAAQMEAERRGLVPYLRFLIGPVPPE